jgi:hypothetical protein
VRFAVFDWAFLESQGVGQAFIPGISGTGNGLIDGFFIQHGSLQIVVNDFLQLVDILHSWD